MKYNPESSLRGKTLFITGASRGIGKAIALRAAQDGANIAIAAKTSTPHPKLPGTIYSAAEEIERLGGNALPIICDIRDEEQVKSAIEKTVERFGGIDIVINNASAISITDTEHTTGKRFDLMHQVNTRGTFLVSKYAIPYLKRSKNNPHILNLSPPLSIKEKWFSPNVAYSIAKYGMSLCVLGMAGELRSFGIGVNALWPYSGIQTAALSQLETLIDTQVTRTPEIMADAAHIILSKDGQYFTGNFCIDEIVLREQGIHDLTHYLTSPGTKEEDLMMDFFIDEDILHKVQELRRLGKLKSKL